MTINKKDRVKILREYKEESELKRAAEKRIAELKKEIFENIPEGQYEDMVLAIEARDVKEYTVAARTDKIIKVLQIGGK